MAYCDKGACVFEEIPLNLIDRGDRYRKDYKDIAQLAASIQEKGLIQPIAVYKRAEDYLLLAGGRRIKAFEWLEKDTIPCRIYDRELSDLEIRAIELAENMDREDFEYHEKIKLQEEIHELMIAVKGPKFSTSPNAKGHSMADTAKMLGKAPASITRDMQIAKAMKQFPDIDWKKMKNKEEAFKVIKKMGKAVINMHKAEVVEKEMGSGESKMRRIYDSYIVGDFFDKAEQLPDGYFNLVEIDPPYSIDLKNKKKGNECDGYNEIPKEQYLDFITKTFRISYSKMAKNSWLICWFGPDPWFADIKKGLVDAGFETTGLVGIWVKGAETSEGISASGQTHMPNYRLANAYEMFYYAWKGNPTLNRLGSSNIFGYKPVPPSRKTHPTERPIELIDSILSIFTAPASRVLVPFAGSGTTLISAFKNNMDAIGFDLTQQYKDSYIVRCSEEFK